MRRWSGKIKLKYLQKHEGKVKRNEKKKKGKNREGKMKM